MNKVKFITMLGDTVRIDLWMLEKAEVEKKAEKHFGKKVTAIAGMYGSGHVGAGWQFRDAITDKVLGYLSLSVGKFHRQSDYEYGINVFVPLCELWTTLPHGKIRFCDGKIELNFGLP